MTGVQTCALPIIKAGIDAAITEINRFEQSGRAELSLYEMETPDLDMDDENTELFTVGRKVPVDLADMDWKSWRRELQKDSEILALLQAMVADITPAHDRKLQELLRLIADKIEHPINEGNCRVLVFSAFSDTAEYLYEHVSIYLKETYGCDTALITGSIDGRTTIAGFRATLNNVLTCFSPVSKGNYQDRKSVV